LNTRKVSFTFGYNNKKIETVGTEYGEEEEEEEATTKWFRSLNSLEDGAYK
jgi:hypothetical protein